MDEILGPAFRETVRFLPTELQLMPLARWNESVFRYVFCRCLAQVHPEVDQFVECSKIDLVLRSGREQAFVEFKFYLRPQRFDPYDGRMLGYKGGPSAKNLAEFQACVDYLHSRRSVEGLSKYVVLAYADPSDARRADHRYATYYDDYRHTAGGVTLRLLDSGGPIEAGDALLQAKLYAVS